VTAGVTTERRSPGGTAGQRSVWLGAARSAGVRLLVLPVSAILGIVVTRLVIENYGTAAFAQYGLLVAIGALLPFTDLGMSAAVVDAVSSAESPSTDERVRRVLVTAIRVLIGSAVVLALLGLVVTALGAWPTLLGAGLLPGSGPLVALCCVLLIALAVPLGVGQRLLVGLGKNHVTVAVLGLQTPLVLAALLLLLAWDVPAGPAVPVLAYAAILVLAAVCAVVAARQIRPLFRDALRQVPRLRSYRGGRVLALAWPMLVQLVAVPVAMQTDRIVLSHRASGEALTQYNLAAQMFTPIWAVVSTAGAALWPVFARARARGERRSPVPVALVFGGLAAAVATVVGLASGWLAELASGGAVTLSTSLVLAFGALMTVQALKYPLGMFLTDAAGLRFQAGMIVAMVPVNVGLSWYLAARMGPAGPVLGSVVGVVVFELAANALYVRHRLRSTPAAPEVRS